MGMRGAGRRLQILFHQRGIDEVVQFIPNECWEIAFAGAGRNGARSGV
jgi:hypothetical protein